MESIQFGQEIKFGDKTRKKQNSIKQLDRTNLEFTESSSLQILSVKVKMSSIQAPIQNHLNGVGMTSNQSLNYGNQKVKCGSLDTSNTALSLMAKCEMCDKDFDQQSLASCPECELIYCMSCCQDIHSKGKLTCHAIFLYMCNICNEISGGYDCFDCGLSFCEGCSTKRHSRGAFTRHTMAVRQCQLAANVYKPPITSLETPCSADSNTVTVNATLRPNSVHNFTHNMEGEEYLPASKRQKVFESNSNDFNNMLNSPCPKNYETWTLLNSNGIMSPGPSNIVQHGNSIINNYMPPMSGQIRNQQLLNTMSVPASMLHHSSTLEEQRNETETALQDSITSSHALSALVNEFEHVDHVGESHRNLADEGFGVPSPPNTGINPSLLMLHRNTNFTPLANKKSELALSEKDEIDSSPEFKSETLIGTDASCFITNISSNSSPIRSPTSTTIGVLGKEGCKFDANKVRNSISTENVAEKFDLSFLNEKPKKKRRIFNPDEKHKLTSFAESLNWTWQAKEVEEFSKDNNFTVQQVKDFIYNRKRNMKHSIPDLTKSQSKDGQIHGLSLMSPPHCAIDEALESITQSSYLSSPLRGACSPEEAHLSASDCVFLIEAQITAD